MQIRLVVFTTINSMKQIISSPQERISLDYASLGKSRLLQEAVVMIRINEARYSGARPSSPRDGIKENKRECQKFCVRDFCEDGFAFLSIEHEASAARSATLLGRSERSITTSGALLRDFRCWRAVVISPSVADGAGAGVGLGAVGELAVETRASGPALRKPPSTNGSSSRR